MIKEQKPRLTIHDWALSRRKDRSKAYGHYFHVLVGLCPTHPNYLEMDEEERLDNPIMSSSKVLRFDFEGRIAETTNTVYELGSIDQFWLKFVESEGLLLSSFDFDLRAG